MVRVAINGFGRIGRLVLRCGVAEKNIDWVVNHTKDIKSACQLFKFDSVHGRFDGDVEIDGDNLVINGRKVKVISRKVSPQDLMASPSLLPWKELKVDVVIESTGVFRGKEDASAHIKAGAKKVVISAPGRGEIESYVLGVNTGNLAKADDVIDNASCTTNCLMPVLKVLNDNFTIRRGFMTTIHAYTDDQKLVDGSHEDPRRARAAALNIVPTKTGAAEAVSKVMPVLKGRLDGKAIRVPVADGSFLEVTAEVEKATTVEEINSAMKKASAGALRGILEYSTDPLVSSDIIGNKSSAVFDSGLTKVSGGTLVQVCAWYDNEMAYSQRVVDLVKSLKLK